MNMFQKISNVVVEAAARFQIVSAFAECSTNVQYVDSPTFFDKNGMPNNVVTHRWKLHDLEKELAAFKKKQYDDIYIYSITVSYVKDANSENVLVVDVRLYAKEQDEFKQYRRTQIAEMVPVNLLHIKHGLSERVSVSASDKEAGSPKLGDMIARNPKNHDDMWLVAKQDFEDNFEPI